MSGQRIAFRNDYSEGAHERILERLAAINRQQQPGYGEDAYCAQAAQAIRRQFGCPDAAVHFLSGGTQTNLTMIASILRPHQGVIAADTGHIAVHETGAIEATGHKVLAVKNRQGKLSAADVAALVQTHWADEAHEHMVQPGMVYISDTTELGSVYTKEELADLSGQCRALQLPLYLDGARLGYALASGESDLAPEDLAKYCSAFSIGGTKQGALFGEALVIVDEVLQRDFRYHIKQRGGMLAKGWLMGVQFAALLEDGLYFDLARHANAQAMRIRDTLADLNIPVLAPSPSNQQFPILANAAIDKLKETFDFNLIERLDGRHTAVRFCTSWATRQEDVGRLLDALGKAMGG